MIFTAGMADMQSDYEAAASSVTKTMHSLNNRLLSQRYLCGDTLSLADVVLFAVLVRFDDVYSILFKVVRSLLCFALFFLNC